MLNKYSILGGIVLASLVYSGKAQAQNCGSGYIQEGGGNAGYITCIQIQPQQQYNSSPSSGSARPKNSLPGFRPSQVPIKELTLPEAVERIATSPTHKTQFEELYGKILFNEPQQGLWVMTSKDSNAKQCSATFFERPNLTSGLTLMGPSQAGAGAMLFQGNQLPRTTEMKEIQPFLAFNDQQPRKVRAALLPSGVLVLADTVSLLRAAKGSGEITLQLDGREVFRIRVNGITEVRNSILKCMGAE